MYDEYVAKIKKIAKVRRTLHKLRFLIGGVFALVFVSTASLVTAKGYISVATPPLDTYVYGETLTYNGKAFLSDVSYEFASATNEEWASRAPYKVGEYKMRVKAPNNFSAYYYSDIYFFKIVAKEITVAFNEEDVIYGHAPTLTYTPALIAGDYVTDDVDYDINVIDEDTWHYDASSDAFIVTNASGENVSNCYNFTVVSKDITILKRSITINAGSTRKVFDDEVVTNEDFALTSGALAPGDRFVISERTAVKEVGNYVNELSFTIINSADEDVSNYYNLTVVNGIIIIDKRVLNLASSSATFVYDGETKPFTVADITLSDEESLLPGHTLHFVHDEAPRLEAGVYINTFTAYVVDENSEVSENYTINYDYGMTRINKRPLSVIADSFTKVYDRSALHVPTFTLDPETSLANSDEIIDVIAPSYVDAGEYVNTLDFAIVDKISGESTLANYEVLKTDGTLLITKIPLTLEFAPRTVTYDGLAHTADFTITEGALLAGERLVINSQTSAIDAGVYDISEFTFDLIDEITFASVAHNYDVTVVGQSGALTIEKAVLNINVENKEKMYDGKNMSAMFNPGEEHYTWSGTLGVGDYIDFRFTNDPRDVGEHPAHKEVKVLHQSGAYPASNDLDVTYNYEISVNDSTFNITKRPLTIKTVDVIHQYDRIYNLSNDFQKYVVDSATPLADNEYIEILHVDAPALDVGNYDYVIDYESLVIRGENYVDVTENYAVTFINNAKRIIVPRPVSVLFEYAEKTYDGTPLSSSAYLSSGLLADDYIYFGGLPEITYVSESHTENPCNNVDVIFFTIDGDNVSHNYELTTLLQSELVITPREITLSSPSLTKTFDNEVFGESMVSVSGEGLAPGDKLIVDTIASTSAKHVRDSGFNSFTYHIVNSANIDVTENYAVTTAFGTLVITPYIVELESLEVTRIYDGSDHRLSSDLVEISAFSSPLYFSDAPLLDGFTMHAALLSDPVIAPDENYQITLSALYSSAIYTVYQDDFSAVLVNTPYTILARPLVVTSASGSKAYDGTVFDQSVTILSGSLLPGHTLEVGEITGVRIIGENMINPVGEITIIDENGVNVTAYYKITAIPGRVTIYEA